MTLTFTPPSCLRSLYRRSLWKHFRAVSLCLFLLIFPAYMAYMICQFFHMDFWLLIIISSSILTSLQVTHTNVSQLVGARAQRLNGEELFKSLNSLGQSMHCKHLLIYLLSVKFIFTKMLNALCIPPPGPWHSAHLHSLHGRGVSQSSCREHG